jgi:hypothetical protein
VVFITMLIGVVTRRRRVAFTRTSLVSGWRARCPLMSLEPGARISRCIRSSRWATARISLFFEVPERPFDFRRQDTLDLHIALEVTPAELEAWFERGRTEGREVRGIVDHGCVRSIYFRDPNGYVIELTAKVAGREGEMDPTKNGARQILEQWQIGVR